MLQLIKLFHLAITITATCLMTPLTILSTITSILTWLPCKRNTYRYHALIIFPRQARHLVERSPLWTSLTQIKIQTSARKTYTSLGLQRATTSWELGCYDRVSVCTLLTSSWPLNWYVAPLYSFLLIVSFPEQIQQLPISFKSAKGLGTCAEELPPGPQWTCQPWPVKYPTKRPVNLYYRDSISCVRSLFSNPLFADHMYYTPFREFKTAEKLVRVYNKWMSANAAWNMQVIHISVTF